MLIFQNFHSLHTKNEQDLNLQRLIEYSPIKRRTKKNDDGTNRETRRNASFKFFVLNANKRQQVCRKAFLNLHSITQKRVYRITTLLSSGKTPVDKRGFNKKMHAVSGETCRLIREHIEMFPKKITHYGGKEIHYLDARLNLKIMHSLFIEKYPESKIKYEFYVKYFNENFSYRFGRPQIDVCSTCEELELKQKSPHLSQHVKLAAKAEQSVHKARSQKFFLAMKECSETCKVNEDRACLVFDYMQNLPLPHLPVQEIFYLRQLWVNAFCIHNLKDNSCQVYLYHEGEAKKGANEVCTFVMDYIKTNLSENVKELHLYSDGCPAQNKNHSFIRFCMALVEDKIFRRIVHRFPIRGHSFLACDRDFGVFKKHIKKCDRIYTPKEYCTIIANSKKNVTVKMVDGDEIFNFNQWWPKFYKKTTLSDDSFGRNIPRDQKVSFAPASYMEFEYSEDFLGKVKTRPFIRSLLQHSFHLQQSGQDRSGPLLDQLLKAYPDGKVKIKKTKWIIFEQLHVMLLAQKKENLFSMKS